MSRPNRCGSTSMVRTVLPPPCWTTRRPSCARLAWRTPWPSIRTSGSMRRSRRAARLVRDRKQLHDAFVFHPPYYRFDGDAEDPPTNFHEWGPQNSRGFRALKVWSTIRQVGRQGYVKMIGDDIELAREMHRLASASDELEALTQSLSITTFRYVPRDLRDDATAADYLNTLNKALLARLQEEGIVYVSNAVIGDVFALRACIVNFRTSSSDVQAVIDAAIAGGRALDGDMRKRP